MKNKFKLLLLSLLAISMAGTATACSALGDMELLGSLGGSPIESVDDSSSIEDSSVEDSSVTPVTKYTVKFLDYDGSVLSQAEYEEGALLQFPNDPTRADANGYSYTFTGWDGTIAERVTANATYTATYSKTAIEYTVTFKADGVQIGDVIKYTVESNSFIEPKIPAKTGYTTVGWEEYTLDGGDKVVNAVYSMNTYKITFKNGDQVVDVVEFNIENKGEKQAPAVPEKVGYSNAGWGAYSFDTLEDQTVALSEYVANKYTITFDANGGTCAVTEMEVTYDDAFTLPAITAKYSFQEFLGWFDADGKAVTDGTWKIAGNLAVKADFLNVVTFEKATSVPSAFSGSRASFAMDTINGQKAVKGISASDSTSDIGVHVSLSYMKDFFAETDVAYLAFDLMLDPTATTTGDVLYYQDYTSGSSKWTRYEDPNKCSFIAAPIGVFKTYYIPRAAYEAWVTNNVTNPRILLIGKGVFGGQIFYIDNLRPVTAEGHIADWYSFEYGAIRDNGSTPLLYRPDYSQWEMSISNMVASTTKFTSTIVSHGTTALSFEKNAGSTMFNLNHNTDTPAEKEMRAAGCIALDLYVSEGISGAAVISTNGFTYPLATGWNTIYARIDATANEFLRISDTTGGVYVLDNIRLLTEADYVDAALGFDYGAGVLRNHELNSEAHSSPAYYYTTKSALSGNKYSFAFVEGNSSNDINAIKSVTINREITHDGNSSIKIEKGNGYMSVMMRNDSTTYAVLEEGFTFWIYSTVEIDGTTTKFQNGCNALFNNGEGLVIPANTWVQITVTKLDMNPTRFLIINGNWEGTIYLDDFQPLA